MTIKGGLLIIISGPSGAGKSSVTSNLLSNIKNLDFSVSYTTRDKRSNEEDEEHYKFISKEKFHEMIDENLFLEYENSPWKFLRHANQANSGISKVRT